MTMLAVTASLFVATTTPSAFAEELEVQIPVTPEIETPVLEIPDHPLPDCEPGAIPLAAVDPDGTLHWSCNPIPGPEPRDPRIPDTDELDVLIEQLTDHPPCPPGFDFNPVITPGVLRPGDVVPEICIPSS